MRNTMMRLLIIVLQRWTVGSGCLLGSEHFSVTSGSPAEMVTAILPTFDQPPPRDLWTKVASRSKKPPRNPEAVEIAPVVAGIPLTPG